MLMRKLTFHACIVGVTLCYSSLPASANASWNGSYAADGACYCAGPVGREIDSRIVPTPVGGQSVAQICERVGKGPALQKVNEKYNFTVYPDAQCGHGPSTTVLNKNDDCLGTKGVAGEDCQSVGPEWDLKAAYAKRPTTTETIEVSSSFALGQSRYIAPPVGKGAGSSSESTNTSVTDIAKIRTRSTPVVQATPDTPEQLRARQLVQIEAARERARLKEDAQFETAASDSAPTIILTEEQKVTQAQATPVTDSNEQVVSETTETIAQTSVASPAADLGTSVSALKLPATTRASSRNFDYVEGMPINFDFGGAGISVAASTSRRGMLHFNLNAAVADTYKEASIGAGIYLTPQNADRVTVLLSGGIEHGQLEFREDTLSAELSDTGAYFGLSSRFTINNKVELQGGFTFSSLFEGDAILTGAAFYHLTPELDLTAKAEAGDNDMLGFGIRFYY